MGQNDLAFRIFARTFLTRLWGLGRHVWNPQDDFQAGHALPRVRHHCPQAEVLQSRLRSAFQAFELMDSDPLRQPSSRNVNGSCLLITWTTYSHSNAWIGVWITGKSDVGKWTNQKTNHHSAGLFVLFSLAFILSEMFVVFSVLLRYNLHSVKIPIVSLQIDERWQIPSGVQKSQGWKYFHCPKRLPRVSCSHFLSSSLALSNHWSARLTFLECCWMESLSVKPLHLALPLRLVFLGFLVLLASLLLTARSDPFWGNSTFHLFPSIHQATDTGCFL